MAAVRGGLLSLEEACARYPYEPYDLPIFTGEMNTRGVANGAPVVASRSDGRPRRRASRPPTGTKPAGR